MISSTVYVVQTKPVEDPGGEWTDVTTFDHRNDAVIWMHGNVLIGGRLVQRTTVVLDVVLIAG